MSEVERELEQYRSLLEQSQSLNAALFEASSDGLAILDAGGRFVHLNRAWERIMELPRDQILGRSEEEIQRWLAYPVPLIWKRVTSGASPGLKLLININGNTILLTAKSHLGADGSLQNVILCARNLTQLSYITEHLKQHEIGDYEKIEEFHSSQLKSLLQATGLGEIVVAGRALRNVLTLASQIAALDATVLIYGETGTGKGLVAKLIHRLSNRASKPLVELNCGAIPETLVESELFGYQGGAFTDSVRSGKKGQIELAHGGTLFLDEVSELPQASQIKLLKFLDDKVIFPVGGPSPRAVDVRIVAATNTDLRRLVREGKFRDDLFYRLEVIPLSIPPLRERREEIAPLAESFLGRFNREFSEQRTFAPEVLSMLTAYDFPGNIRELRNLIARLVISAQSEHIALSDLPESLRRKIPSHIDTMFQEYPADIQPGLSGQTGDIALRERFRESEREILERYAQTCNSAREIGRRLGLHHSSVLRKLKKYHIRLADRELPPR